MVPISSRAALKTTSKGIKIGAYPQYGWDFPEDIPEKFRKDPGNALRVFPGIPLESTAGIPQALSFKAFEASRPFPEFSPPQYGWGRLIFRSGSGEGLSELVMEFPTVLRVFLKNGTLCFVFSWAREGMNALQKKNKGDVRNARLELRAHLSLRFDDQCDDISGILLQISASEGLFHSPMRGSGHIFVTYLSAPSPGDDLRVVSAFPLRGERNIIRLRLFLVVTFALVVATWLLQ